MKTLLAATLGFLFILPNTSFSQALSPASQRVKSTYLALEKQPDAKQKQIAYLKAFPSNTEQFKSIFHRTDFSQLYNDSHEYIKGFVGLSKNYPVEVIDKSVNVGKGLVWDADATGDMQHSIVAMGSQYTKTFISKLKSLTASDENRLITFLADVENHKAYPEYQKLIDALKKNGETTLADKFIEARTQREKAKHD